MSAVALQRDDPHDTAIPADAADFEPPRTPLRERLGGRATAFAVAFMLGVGLGLAGMPVWLASALAGLALSASVVLGSRRRGGSAALWAVVAACPLGGAWAGLDAASRGNPSLAAFVPEGGSVLARVTGTIEQTVRDTDYRRGAMGRFAYQPPGTVARLRVETIELDRGPRRVRGAVLLRLREHDHTLREAMRVEATGWLRVIDGPGNPGEFDFAALMAERGVVGRLTLPGRGNWRELDAAWYDLPHRVASTRAGFAAACLDSLRIGMRDAGASRGLLETLLLGHWGDEMADLRESFRHVGLAHILSISGAHLGILMGLVWLGVRLVLPHPPRSALVVLAVLLMYVMALPMRTPIVRAAIMAGVFCIGYGIGRRPSAMGLWSTAAVLVLLWRPAELASPGFQLSFGVVAALLLWTPGVSRMLLPPPVIEPVHPTLGQWLSRRAADYAAVSLIAFGVAMPVVAYHYQLVSPLAMVTSVLALPVLTAVLALGYVKIALGLVAGEPGGVLAGPLRWLSETMIALVVRAEAWPWASVALPEPPPAGWVLAAVAGVSAAASGRFRGRRWPRGAAVAAVLLLSLWWTTTGGVGREPVSLAGAPTTIGATSDPLPGAGVGAAARVTMIAVGDGSCFVVELPGHTLMFDCGNQAYLDLGLRSVAPALDHFGIDRLDTLFISHADLDHFAGVLDVIDRIPVGRVVTTPQLLAEARREPGSAAGFLLTELRLRGLEPTAVTRGWREHPAGDERVTLTALWPPADFQAERNNDASLVLAIDLELGTPAAPARRRVLLNGDIQHDAKPALLAAHDAAAIDLNADVTDLPHHGSFVDASPAWLDAVDPEVILQSTGHARLRRDPWADALADHAASRYTTPEHGCTTVTVHRNGALSVETFR